MGWDLTSRDGVSYKKQTMRMDTNRKGSRPEMAHKIRDERWNRTGFDQPE
jgi:hypothetical protein